MRALIAISSCERDAQRGFEQAMRDTWLQNLPEGFYFRFFRGIPASIDCGSVWSEDGDVVTMNVKDDYESLPFKTRDSLRWAIEHGYDFVFRVFTDTCVHTHRLASCGFEQFDYFGHFPGGYSSVPDARGWFAYASGGPGYFLSRRACEAVVNSEPDHWAEDLWVGNVMGRNGFTNVKHEPRFFFKWSQPKHDTVSVHLSRGTGNYESCWMPRCYRELLNS